jgi:ubiquinone/menaquinone biosynthesis C-methylase UbiE
MTAEALSAGGNERIKQCCSDLYQSDFARLLLGESFHPGGLRLTERLGVLLGLNPESRPLDVASGNGGSAIFLAQRFGCKVVGVDFGRENVERATAAAASRNLGSRVRFAFADAERLPFDDEAFDAVICECSFCTFPEKEKAAREFARMVRPGGRVGLSDVTRTSKLSPELEGLLPWVACVGDALSLEGYARHLQGAGVMVSNCECHDYALREMVDQIRDRLFGLSLKATLRKDSWPVPDFTQAKVIVKAALEAIQKEQLGYAIICGVKA